MGSGESHRCKLLYRAQGVFRLWQVFIDVPDILKCRLAQGRTPMSAEPCLYFGAENTLAAPVVMYHILAFGQVAVACSYREAKLLERVIVREARMKVVHQGYRLLHDTSIFTYQTYYARISLFVFFIDADLQLGCLQNFL